MSDTPRTDAAYTAEPSVINSKGFIDMEFARQLERELNEWKQRAEKYEIALHDCYIQTGEEAGDVQDFRALVDREKHVVMAVAKMRLDLDKAER